jgi:hypothetical protein
VKKPARNILIMMQVLADKRIPESYAVQERIRCQPQAFFGKCIRMLPERWKKRVESGGEHVED